MHQKRIRFLFGALALPFTTSLSCKDPEKTKTIYWGNGRYQARPDLIIFFENFTPKEINSWEGGLNNPYIRIKRIKSSETNFWK